MENTITTTPAAETQPDLSRVVEEALDAFWDVVSDYYPLTETGDLSAVSTGALDNAAQRAVEEWVKNNAPFSA